MLPCAGCGYRRPIPGNTHSRCVFNWFQPVVVGFLGIFSKVTARTQRWFRFPFNYDPVWGPDICNNRSETLDPEKVAPENPLAEILSMLR